MLSRLWGTIMPEICRRAHIGEEWKCFFGYKIYPTLKSEWWNDVRQRFFFNKWGETETLGAGSRCGFVLKMSWVLNPDVGAFLETPHHSSCTGCCFTCALRPGVCGGVAVWPGPADGLQRHCDGAACPRGHVELPTEPRKGNEEHTAPHIVRFNATHKIFESNLFFLTVLVYFIGLHLLHPVCHMSSLTQSKLIHLKWEHLSFTFLKSVSNTDLHLKTKKILYVKSTSS